MIKKFYFSIVLFFGLFGFAEAGYLDDVGFTQLEMELGVLLPDGASIEVSQVEASTSTNSPIYFPNTNDTQFIGKTFTDESGDSLTPSSHATTAGQYYYGSSSALARGVNTVGVHYVNTWLNDQLSPNGGRAPRVEGSRVQNHSWVGSSGSATNTLMRLDYMVHRDGVVCVVGLNNGSGNPHPELLSQSYNTIAAGMSNGNHSQGVTSIAEAGRTKPELVAPFGATSWAAALISSAAALLLDHGGAALENRPQLTKAILLAGATKHEFPDWDRNASRPLDEIYGAGELHIYRSYHILDAGEQNPSTNGVANLKGWDFLAVTGGSAAQYFFDVPAGFVLHRFSAIATWHRIIEDSAMGPSFVPFVSTIRDVDLTFRNSTAFVPGAVVDLSTSRVDNVEHIYQGSLPAGQYVLEVTSDGVADCGVAWIGELVKLPTAPSITVDTSLVAHIQFEVSEGFDYRVEATEALSNTSVWQTIFSGSVSSNVLEMMDGDAALYEQRYYRFAPEP